MAETTRRYESSVRSAQKARTRARVVDAAAKTFLEHGYSGATVPAIARAAGVAVETVYRSATGKPGLLESAVQAALAGGSQQAEVPVEQRPGIARMLSEQDPRRILALYARTQPGLWHRVGPLLRVLDAAADTDPALHMLRARQAEQRLHGNRRVAALVAERGQLRPGLTVETAGDLVYALCAQATYEALVNDRGWSHREYAGWLGRVLAASLLDDGNVGQIAED